MKPSLFAISCIPLAVAALKLPVRQTKRDSFGVLQSGTANAGSLSGQVLSLTDTQDLMYIAVVAIQGQSFRVQLDTGSSDLWVSTSKVLGKQSDIYYNLTYGIGFAYGPIATAQVSFAGFDVEGQAYLAGQQVNNPAIELGAQGVLGTGFTSLSSIDSKVNKSGATWGGSLLNNIFRLNPSEPNFMAFALQRNDDPDKDVQGSFTIGEYHPDYAGVANTTPIPTYPEKNPTRWNVLIDKLIIAGQSVSFTSAVKNAPSGQAVGLLDTGTSHVYAPKEIVDHIYSGLRDSVFSDSLNRWVVPCDVEVDVSLVIGGRQFDLHPLDTVQPTDTGSTTCTGSWLPQTLTVGKSEFDILLGDAVLRSIYTVYDFGDFDANQNMGDPYVRLWSLVDGSDASIEFHQVRGGSPNNTFLPNNNVNAASANANTLSSDGSSGSSSGSDVADLKHKVDTLMKWAPAALGLAGLNVLVMLVVLIVAIVGYMRRRKGGRTTARGGESGNFIPLGVPGSGSHQYRPVSLQSAFETPKYSAPGARYSD